MMTRTDIPPIGPVATPEPLPDSLPDQSPGAFLRQELAARGLTQGELAVRTNLSAKHVNQVIQSVVPLSTDMALRVERATGLSSSLLISLQARWDAHERRQEARADLGAHRGWFETFPRDVLVREQIINNSEPIEDQIDDLLKFFGVADPHAYEELLADSLLSFRRAQHLNVDEAATALWLRLGERVAESLIQESAVPAFSKKAFQELLDQLPPLTKLRPPRSFEQLRDLCLEVGVIVLLLREVNGSRANAVTRWVANRPVLILTDRGKFEDTVWFNFFHEAGHVLLHPKRKSAVNLGKTGDDADGHESEANEFATDYLLRHKDPHVLAAIKTAAGAKELAQQLDVDEGIVAGQTAYRYNRFPHMQGTRRGYQIP